jgi:hypothetical protein
MAGLLGLRRGAHERHADHVGSTVGARP